MPTKIPTFFDRIKTTKLPAVNGWVYVTPVNGGSEYLVSGSGQGQDRADHRTVHSIVREKISALGGEVPYMSGPNPEWESAASVVSTLLEDDPDIDSAEAVRLAGSGYRPKGMRRESKHVDGYLTRNRQAGEGKGVTVATYLSQTLSHSQKCWGIKPYKLALFSSLENLVELGLATRGLSATGVLAYYPTAQWQPA